MAYRKRDLETSRTLLQSDQAYQEPDMIGHFLTLLMNDFGMTGKTVLEPEDPVRIWMSETIQHHGVHFSQLYHMVFLAMPTHTDTPMFEFLKPHVSLSQWEKLLHTIEEEGFLVLNEGFKDYVKSEAEHILLNAHRSPAPASSRSGLRL